MTIPPKWCRVSDRFVTIVELFAHRRPFGRAILRG